MPQPLRRFTSKVYSYCGSELNNSLSKAKTDLKISNYCFVSASVQTIQALGSPRGVIGSTLEKIIKQGSDEEETIDVKVKKEILSDLLRNEHVYQQSLKNLHYIYAEPIRHFSYLRPEEHQQIFWGIETLISISSVLTFQLGYTLSNGDPNNSNIGYIFPAEIWTHYNKYYCKYPQIKNLLDQKLQEESPFAEFCQENRICTGQSVDDLLFLPCQRIPEYEQYLSSLLEKTEENQPEYQSLKRAIAQIKQILHGCYEDPNGTGHTENNKNHFLHSPTQLEKDKISEDVVRRRKSSPGAVLFKKTKFSRMSGDKNFDPDILNFARYQSNVRRLYIMEGAVQLTISMQTQDRYLFLFDDLLLVAKQKSNNQFKLKYCVRICEIWLATCLDEISEVSHDEEKSFVIGWPTISKVATFPSKDLKEKWQTRLKQLIDEKKEIEKPKEIILTIQYTEQKQTTTMFVQNTAMVREVIKKCLEQFQIPKGDVADFQLWPEYGDNDSTPYPLIGPEIPYNIKMNHIRNNSEKDDCDNTEAKRKSDFIFTLRKKATKKQNTDEIDGKTLKKIRHHFNLFKKSPKLEEKPLGKIFGQPLDTINDNPSKPIDSLLRFLFKQGPSTSGIFRKAPNAKKKRELCEMLDQEETINMADVTGHLAAAVLMEYLRNIPQGLLVDDKYADWIEAGKLLNETEKLTKIQSLVRDLPPCNRQLLQQLICILYYINKKSSESLMPSQNLATCTSPSILGSKVPDSQEELMAITEVITYMIENCVQVFGEEIITLFGEVPSERLHEDSDTDSFHSTLSTQEPGGLHQSDDSSMHSLDRDFGSAEPESSSSLSPTTQTTSDPDSISNGVQHFKDEDISAYEKILVKKSPQKNDSQDSEDSVSSLASNDSAFPVPPPRRNRLNYMGAKYKSMTSIDIADETPMKKEYSSQSVNDLLGFTSDPSEDNTNVSDYSHKKMKSVQSGKKTLNSRILRTEGHVSNIPTRNPKQESNERIAFTKNLSSISQHTDHEESPEIDQRVTVRKSLGKIPQSKSVEDLNHSQWQLRYQHHQHKQHQRRQYNTHSETTHLLNAPQNACSSSNKSRNQNNVQAPHSERKHLPLAPQNSFPSVGKSKQQHNARAPHPESTKLPLAPQNSCPLSSKSKNPHEIEIRLALFKNNTDSPSTGKPSKVTPQKMNKKFPRIDLKLSPPPNVLLQKIGPPFVEAKREAKSSHRDPSNTTCKNSKKFDDGSGTHFSHGRELARSGSGSGRVQLNHTSKAYSEKNQPSKKVLNHEKRKVNTSASPYLAASVEIPRGKPKHPPSYEEAIQQKQQQHEISEFAKNLYTESLKEYRQNSGTDEENVKSPHDEKLTSHHAKLYRKHHVNSSSPRKLAQGQYEGGAEKSRRKSAAPNNMVSMSRLQRGFSKSESDLNFLCSDAPDRKHPAASSSYSKVKNERYADLSDDENKRHRNLERTKDVTFEPGIRYRNATNQNILHKPLSKTKSAEFAAHLQRTMDCYHRSKESVLPWSVSDMISRFSTPNDELPPH